MEALLIDGIEILYSTHHSNIILNILFWLIAVVFLWFTISLIRIIVKDKEWKCVSWVFIWIAMGSIILFNINNAKTPYTTYHIKLDDTIPYNYMVNNFDEIQHEGENCYKIIIKDK